LHLPGDLSSSSFWSTSRFLEEESILERSFPMAPSSIEVSGREKEEFTKEHAESLDARDPLRHFRKEFIIPTIADLKRKTLAKPSYEESEECIYLCGNSLGLQPRRTNDRVQAFLSQWSTKAVTGHFVEHEDSPLAPFLHIDDHAARLMAPIVGALESEVAVMGQLTANLLLMMSSFYRPSKEKFKIILEGKAFPSDHVRSVHYSAIKDMFMLMILVMLVCH
jgi:kynureninase